MDPLTADARADLESIHSLDLLRTASPGSNAPSINEPLRYANSEPISPSLSQDDPHRRTSSNPTPPQLPARSRSLISEPATRKRLLSSNDTNSASALLGHSLTSNALFYDIPVSDAFSELLERHIPPEERPQRDNAVGVDVEKPKGPDVLVGLVMNNMWRSVARYARQRLVQIDPLDLDTILHLWYIRLLALTKLGLHQLASAEFEKLGDLNRPEFTAEYHSQLYPGRTGTLIPFELWVLWACLPAWLKYPLMSLERITMLAVFCKKMQFKDKEKATMWKKREMQVYLVLSTQLMEMNDFSTAASTMEMVLNNFATSEDGKQNIDILSGLGRLYLQLGDYFSAEKLYKRIEDQESQDNDPSVKEAILTNKAFLFMADGEWSQAKRLLQQVYDANADNLLVVNNLAVCEVYLGQLSNAIDLLERLTKDNPTSAGTCETVLMNLCTLYELRYDSAVEMKIGVLKQVARWVGDSFHAECIKLQ